MQIALNKVQVGMILSKELVLAGGKAVLKKGQALSADIITILQKSSIASIEVEDVAACARPKISVYIADDASYANMSIEPAGNPSEILTMDIILGHLESAGVKFGIDKKAIEKVADMWLRSKHRYDINKVAVAKPPEEGREGVPQMLVLAIRSREELDKIREDNVYWKVHDVVSQYQAVFPGMAIADNGLALPPVNGTDVRGEPLVTDIMVQSSTVIEKGAVLSTDKSTINAVFKGYAYQIGDAIGVVEINFDGDVEIELAKDLMNAKMIVHPCGEGGKMPDEKKIRLMLVNNKVNFGVHEELLKNTIFEFSGNRFPAEPLVIAEGIAPQSGENGKLEFLFNTETSLTPKENPDGSVDYKSVSIINSVSKGDILCRRIPPTKGVPGKNVCGQPVKCTDGVAAKLPQGPNTDIDPDDQDCLMALIDGAVRYNGTAVEICEGFVVKGDVDFSTGHIKYGKSVIISGDVKSGFNVDCGGDLQVGGVIEDSHVVIGGNLLCKYGFVGQGKGLIEVSGDANIGFMKNQVLKCRKSVNVAKEVLNGTIYAKKSINVHGKPLSVAGGTLVARESVTLYTVGNMSGIKTLIEVGIDYTLVEELEKTDKMLNDLNTDYAKLVDSQNKYTKIIEIKGRAAVQERAIVAKLCETMTKYKNQISILEERRKLIMKKMYNLDSAFIRIEHAALQGTLFKFGERHYLVKDEIIGPKTIRLVDHEIKVI